MLQASPESIPTEYLGNVTAYLGWDNERMEVMLLAMTRFADAGQWEAVREQFAAFSAALDRHIRMEEQVIYPIFEQATRLAFGPIAVMRREHADILAVVGVLAGAITHRLRDALRVGRARLDDVLGPHNQKEERVVYPVTDRWLSPFERRRVMARLLAFR